MRFAIARPHPEAVFPLRDATQLRLAAGAGFVALALLGVVILAISKPLYAGDSFEYVYMTQAFINHQSPDVRDGDIVSATPVLAQNGVVRDQPRAALFKANNGRDYFSHFWAYPVLLVPATLLLRLAGGNELAALQVTNGVLFFAALAALLFLSPLQVWRRLLIAALVVVTPVLWYIGWPGPEVFTWSFVLISLALLDRGRYVPASLAAALASMQNPSAVFLIPFVAFVALRRDGRRSAVLALAGGLPALLPYAFFYATYGHPHVLTEFHLADPGLISTTRTLSFFFDLNQGMVVYVPLLLIVGGLGLIYAWRASPALALAASCLILLMVLPTESITNWNSGNLGMLRYALWLTPVLAWLAGNYVRFSGRTASGLIVGALAAQALLLLVQPSNSSDYVKNSPLASYVLSHAPHFYSPEKEIFTERQLGQDGVQVPDETPVAFLDGDGDVTKLLISTSSIPKLPDVYDVDADYLKELEARYAGRIGKFYVNPPRGAILAKEGGATAVTPGAALYRAAWSDDHVPQQMTAARPQCFSLRVQNLGEMTWYHVQVFVSYHWLVPGDAGQTRMAAFDGLRSPLPADVPPQAGARVDNACVLPPAEPGSYLLQVTLVQDAATWFEAQGAETLQVPVTVVAP